MINNIINFDNKTGLTVSSRGEILDDLITLTKMAYGQDYVIEQGNEWYTFLDLLAGTLTELGGAVQCIIHYHLLTHQEQILIMLFLLWE